ncbi:MAG: glycosyltransferase family 4 protein [Methanomassiliicoccales archaeon]|jgi:glycosyltransferase involved in cell wall biosynthesis|nr:glycosyltransferase family 4 protein [Methanomassiliicoccales archaeon]
MRVTFVTFEYPPFVQGGAGVYAASLTRELAKLGHEVTVLALGEESGDVPYVPEAGIEVRRIPGRGNTLRWVAFNAKVTKDIERSRGPERPDVVHLNSLGHLGFRDRPRGPAYVATAHHLVGELPQKAGLRLSDRAMDFSGENGFLIQAMERLGTGLVDRIIAVSQETGDGLQRLYKVDPGRIDVVWNGVSEDGMPREAIDRDAVRARLGFPPGKALLFVGRVDDPRKCLGNLIQAASGVPEASVIAVGSGDGSRARQLAKELGMEPRLAILGRLSQEDLWSAYVAADAHVCASRQEGFGLTIAEAMCADCPVISTEVGVARELSGRLEAVVPVNDVPALQEAIASTLSSCHDRSRPNRVRVPEELSWRRCAKETAASYEKAIGQER